MDLFSIAVTLWRHKTAVLVVTVLTVLGSVITLVTLPSVYESTATILLVPPPRAPAEEPLAGADNPYTRAYDASIVINVVAAAITADPAREELMAQGADRRYDVAQTVRYGFASPVAEILGSGSTPEEAKRTAELVVAAFEEQLRAIQAAEDVDERYFIATRVVDPADPGVIRASGKLRAVIAVVGLGLLALFAVVTVSDALARWRAERETSPGTLLGSSGDGAPPIPPEDEAAPPAESTVPLRAVPVRPGPETAPAPETAVVAPPETAAAATPEEAPEPEPASQSAILPNAPSDQGRVPIPGPTPSAVAGRTASAPVPPPAKAPTAAEVAPGTVAGRPPAPAEAQAPAANRATENPEPSPVAERPAPGPAGEPSPPAEERAAAAGGRPEPERAVAADRTDPERAAAGGRPEPERVVARTAEERTANGPERPAAGAHAGHEGAPTPAVARAKRSAPGPDRPDQAVVGTPNAVPAGVGAPPGPAKPAGDRAPAPPLSTNGPDAPGPSGAVPAAAPERTTAEEADASGGESGAPDSGEPDRPGSDRTRLRPHPAVASRVPPAER